MAVEISGNGGPTAADMDDRDGGMLLERIVFNNRLAVLGVFLLVTLTLGYFATQLPVNASFDKMIPRSHPYIQNYFQNRDSLPGMGNTVRIAVENTDGTIFDKNYLLALQKVSDTVFLLDGVDRAYMRSLWTPSLRWTEVTEQGFAGGPVMPAGWTGDQRSTEQLKENIGRAGIVGSIVANDMKSSLIQVPLLERNSKTGERLDYTRFSRDLEEKIRALEGDGIKIHIVGFAKLVGDLIEGLYDVIVYFAFSVLIAAALVFAYTRCLRSTVLLVCAAVIGVVWLLGLLRLLGYALDPYSILVPFLIFAVGLSHGAQKMNGIMQDVGRGVDKYMAARFTFRRLFRAGLTALLTNIVGFAVLAVIDIPALRDLAITTSLGVALLIFTKLIFIPVMLSYIGVSKSAAARSLHKEEPGIVNWIRERLARLTQKKRAAVTIGLAVVLALFALFESHKAEYGDLHPGAPELRPDSRYNRDSAFITSRYGLTADQFVVMLKTPPHECQTYPALVEADRLGAALRATEGVRSVFSTADGVRMAVSGMFEADPRWLTIPRNESNRSLGFNIFQRDRPELAESSCSLTPIVAYLADHKAATLDRVVGMVEDFAAEHNTDDRQFLLAAGNAGIESVTNIVVRQGFWTMHFALYGAVVLLCFLTFRSWRAVVVALVPLIITSLLCEAIMVWMDMGIKVATLPVIAVGVGVGVDYALYLLSVQITLQRQGMPLREAYLQSLDFTGRIVALIGFTMAAGVLTWIWSPIKFQADMGILLTFMFIWNMLGALILIPALSRFLLRGPDAA
jgi:predicted RND superfamily exporter protein